MNAQCGECGKTVEFPPSKRGLLEKCAQCGEIFKLEPIATPLPQEPPTPIRPKSMQSPPVAQFFSIFLLVGATVGGLAAIAISPLLLAFLVLVPGVFLIIIMAQMSELLALMRRAEIRDIERDRRNEPLR